MVDKCEQTDHLLSVNSLVFCQYLVKAVGEHNLIKLSAVGENVPGTQGFDL